MNLVSISGILLAIIAIVGGNYLAGGAFDELLNIPALLIVVGGTFAAVFVQSSPTELSRAITLSGSVFGHHDQNYREGINHIVSWCVIARRKGLLALEDEISKQQDSFVRNGLQMLVDGRTPDVIRSTLETELVSRENRDLQAAKVLESMGGYAPTMGIIGAVLGLIHVMSNLADPANLGSGIATAFVATIYGVAIANLLFLPLANKIRSMVLKRFYFQEMMLEGLLSIAEGQNPRIIQLRLQGYLEQGA
ncbi:flagellar motor protein [Amphritea pacifica]|uniref:Flagellar motor protein n=1 Tax=Amphritea pacifica TaxID=2811233 RepID=A0ABS2W567_9GAMM|nr:flagellar motor protein [Amphritea pacifica]MBN0986845.1 flagellar motor protein [Amphritea pacifica]MBN1005286.1 flagellar motor protein [Amphritea pacifica]